jgi:mannan endo-1,4-beta-mannosidase
MGMNNAQRLTLIMSCFSVLPALAAGGRLPSIHAGAGDAAIATAAGQEEACRRAGGFARANGTRFMVAGRPFYSNGFNAYWLMYMASSPADRSKVIETLDQASRLGARLIRTMAFNDGGSNRPLQISPGVYNEDTFMVRTCIISR